MTFWSQLKNKTKQNINQKKQFCSLEKANDCETGAGAVLRFLFWLLLFDRWCESHGRREGELSGKKLVDSTGYLEKQQLLETLYTA